MTGSKNENTRSERNFYSCEKPPHKDRAMAIVRKVTTEQGISWKVDYYDPQGRRIKKRFKKKAEAEAYLAKVVTSIKEEKYEDIFEKKKGSQLTFDELADHYVEIYRQQKSFHNFKKQIVQTLREAFGPRRLSQITYLDLEKHRNARKPLPPGEVTLALMPGLTGRWRC
jgi:hypothetical protein